MPANENLPAASPRERESSVGGGASPNRRTLVHGFWGLLGIAAIVLLMGIPASPALIPISAHVNGAPNFSGPVTFDATVAPASSVAPTPTGIGMPHPYSLATDGPIIQPINANLFDSASSISSTPTTASTATTPVLFGTAPAVGGYQTANFSGRVVDARTGVGIAGATVKGATQGGHCPSPPCSPVTTKANGSFTNLIAAAPQVDVTASANGYLSNFTSVSNVVPGLSYNVGTIALQKEGTVTGTIEGNDGTHEIVKCSVLISSVSRDALTIGLNLTVSSGTFTIPVPPFPTVMSFDPKCPQYDPIQYWVNVSAYSVYNLGPVYLPVNVIVQASVYDAVTKKSVSGYESEIQVCSYGTAGNCAAKGASVTGGNPKAWAPTGYDKMTVWADDPDNNGEDAAVNTTMIGYVPAVAPGTIYHVSAFVDPLGLVSLDVGFTYERQLVAHKVTQSWPVGSYAVISPTSLDGYSQWSNYNPISRNFSTVGPPGTCVSPSAITSTTYSPVAIYAPPLRDSFQIEPDSGAQCAPPSPTWPIPIDLPVWGNYTMANVSPLNSQVASIGWFNLTPGTYVEGGVYGVSAAPLNGAGGQASSPISIGSAPRDYTSGAVQSYSSAPTAQPAPPFRPGFDPTGCTGGSWYLYCVPVGFGPWTITLTASGGGGSATNTTWVDVPPGDFGTSTPAAPIPMQAVDEAPMVHVLASGATTSSGGFAGLAFTNASVSGHVYIAGTRTAPYSAVTVTVGLAGSAPSEILPASGTVSSTGAFTVEAYAGWDYATFSSPDYLQNQTWFYVPDNVHNINIGIVNMTPLATLDGQVVTETGAGILQATADYCPIATQSSGSCSQIGTSGTTNSNGQYSGLIPAYPLPRGAYKLTFTAAGYASNWTWVNVTAPGSIVYASTITLQSLTSAAAPRPAALPPATASTVSAEWVVGNVVDNVTGLPAAGLSISWESPGSSTATGVGTTDTNVLDDFNTSIPVGTYYLNFSAPSYYPVSILINVSGLDSDAVDYIGTISMNPETFFSGRVETGPWNWTYLTASWGLGPGLTTAQVCTQTLSNCGSTETLNLGGFFNLTGPIAAGQYDVVKIVPGVKGGAGTAPGGWSSNTSATGPINSTVFVNMTAEPIIVNIFGIVVSMTRDESTNNTTAAMFPQATMINYVNGHAGNTTTMLTNANGTLYGITPATLPQFHGYVNITAQGLSYLPGASNRGTVGWGSLTLMNNISLPHFGWIAGVVTGAVAPFAPVPYATASMTDMYGTPPLQSGSSGAANGAGYLNITAPPGVKGTLNVSAPDYNYTNASGFSIFQSVTASIATLLAGANGSKGAQGGLYQWGWVRGVVLDNKEHFGLGNAIVSITSRYSTTGTTVDTNNTGGYFIDSPVAPGNNVSINLTDYRGNYTDVSVASGQVETAPLVNLTGDGIVAGYVVSFPGGIAVPFANISLCPTANPLCSNQANANGSGFFWIAGGPGIDNLTVSYSGFVTTSELVNVSSDRWQWVGRVVLDEYAILTGAVIGLPSGIPVNGANVSVCSVLAFQEGVLDCPYVTMTSGTIPNAGEFTLTVPASDYILQVNATLYNTTFLPIQLTPGEKVSVGVIELQLYGFAVGEVYGQDTLQAVNGTIVNACPTWETGNCTAVTVAPPSAGAIAGQYSFNGPPGPYQITATAPGYEQAGIVVRLLSGAVVNVPPIYLQPIGPGNRFTISGTVVAEPSVLGGTAVPFSGALVSDNVGDTAATNSQGQFVLSVSWGNIVITVHGAGYGTITLPVQVRGNVSGLNFSLEPQTYTWRGYVTDGVDDTTLAGVAISLGGLELAETDLTGHYAFALPNGTYQLTAGYPISNPASQNFGAVGFSIVVNGANGVRDVALVPPTRTLEIQAISGPSGEPIANASIVTTGVVRPEDVGATVTSSTDPNGAATIEVFTGVYNVTVSASGFLTASVPVTALAGNATSIPVTVTLQPIQSSAGGAGSGGLSPSVGVVLAGGVVAVAAGVFLLTRRSSAANRAAATRPAGGTE